jgi:hypothetical protein
VITPTMTRTNPTNASESRTGSRLQLGGFWSIPEKSSTHSVYGLRRQQIQTDPLPACDTVVGVRPVNPRIDGSVGVQAQTD